jgi:hypothetical protein
MEETLGILDGIRAEPDELFKIGAVSSRIERLIDELKSEGGADGRINETKNQNQREADIEGGMVLRRDGRDGRCREVDPVDQQGDRGCRENIHFGREDTRDVMGRLTEPLPTGGSA